MSILKKVYDQNKIEEKILYIEINNIKTECIIIDILDENDKFYIILLPKDKKYIYKGKLLVYELKNDNGISLHDIFEDEEYDYIIQKSQEILQDKGYFKLIEKYRKIYDNEMRKKENENNSQ